MSHPERLREGSLKGVEIPAKKAASMLGLTYKMIDHWATSGIIHPDQVSRTPDHHHAEGPGSKRVFDYRRIQELGFVSRIRPVCSDLEVLRELVNPIPEGYSDWGQLIVDEANSPGLWGIFHPAPKPGDPILSRSPSPIQGELHAVSIVVDLLALRRDTDARIRSVV